MTLTVTQIIDPAFAPVFGLAGLAAQMVWPLFRTRETILMVQLGSVCSYAASYALMGQTSATATCLIGAIQTTIALIAGNRPWLSQAGYAFIPAVLILGLMTYSGLPTLLVIAACSLSMIGRMQRDPLRMRSVQMSATPFGATHDLVVGAWPAAMGAVVSFTIAAVAFRRELRLRNQAEHHA